nr:L,D-transpeptidase [Synechococcus sp. MU1655]
MRPVSLGRLLVSLKCTACASGLPVALFASSLLVAAPALSRSQLTHVSMAVRHPVEGRVVLDLGRRQISVVRQGQTLGPWPVAIGDPKTPTPSGMFKVENMMINPQYQSTKSGKVHPKRGPQSPLGHRWIGFLRSGPNQFGIHGTPWPHWVKTRAAVSNGCVRMLNAHVQQLYDHVEVGMAVEITR